MSNIKLVHSGGNSVSLTTPDSNPAANRTVKFPDANGILALTNGITEFDQWYLTASVTSNGDITSNLSRNDKTGAPSQIGTGMSQSSGVFTFPITGKYLVICAAEFAIYDADNVIILTKVTTNNSSYTNVARALDGNNGSGERSGGDTSFSFVDVTDTSQVKVKFEASSIGTNSSITGSTGLLTTSFLFIRLGDT